MIKNALNVLRDRLEKRRRYRRMISEIEALNARDLQDLRADDGDMRRAAYESVYSNS